ncbi:MAG TPA: MFS transporter [Alphaproteobacteria bacterium]|nr:MFS transporter [Alphaproteobacteria bacterium]
MPAKPRAGRIRIAFMFVLFAVLFGTGQFHRVSTGVIMPELARELALGAGVLGTISGVYFLCAAAMQIPVGLCLDRFGARRTVPAVMSVSFLGTILFAGAHSAGWLIFGRALMGVGFASVLMGAYAVFARWVPVDRFSTFSAWMIAVGSMGGMTATAPLAAAVEWVGWRPTLLAVGVFTVLLVIATCAGVRDAPPGYLERGRRPSGLIDSLRGLIDVLRKREMRHILAMGVATYGPGMVLLGLWGGPFLADVHGLGPIERGHILFAMALGSPLGLVVIGPLDRVLNSRKRVVLVFATAKAAAFAALAAWPQAPLALVAALMVWVMFSQSYYVALQSHCRAVVPDTMVGRATTSLNLVSVGGVALMQIATGAIVEAFPAAGGIAAPEAYRWVFGGVALVILLAVLAYSRVEDMAVRSAV